MLSKRDLLLATVARKKTDRIPVAMWRHFPVEDKDPDTFVARTLAFQNEFDFDFIKAMPSWLYTIEDYGGKGRYEGHPDGIVSHGPAAVSTIEQWEALQPLDARKGALARELRSLKKIVQGAGDTPVIQTVFSPLMVAYELTNDLFLVWMRRYPEAFARGLAAIVETWVKYTGAILRAGAAGIFFAVNRASYTYMGWEEYKHWGVPNDRTVLDAARGGWFNMMHVHGEHLMFNHLMDYPVQAVNWYDRQTRPSLKEAKDIFPGAVIGGIDHHGALLLEQPHKVKAEVREAIAQTGGSGYIVGPGCGLPLAVTKNNIRAAVEAARAGAK